MILIEFDDNKKFNKNTIVIDINFISNKKHILIFFHIGHFLSKQLSPYS